LGGCGAGIGEGRRTVERIPEEDFASQEAAAHFVDPGVVKGHPGWFGGAESGRFDVVPEAGLLDVLAAVNYVSREIWNSWIVAYKVIGFHDHRFFIANLQSFIDWASTEPVGGYMRYLFLQAKITIGQRPRTLSGATGSPLGKLTKHQGWKQVRKPEANIFLRIHHSDGSSQGTDINHEIKVQIYT
jgi:hypothetical protein